MLHEPEVSTPTSPAVTGKVLANGENSYVQSKPQHTTFRLASPEGAKVSDEVSTSLDGLMLALVCAVSTGLLMCTDLSSECFAAVVADIDIAATVC